MFALIKTKEAHERALKRIAELMETDPDPQTNEGKELELLAHLVQTFEKQSYCIKRPDPIAAIRFCMEQQRLTPNDLVPFLGTRSRVSEVLGKKRSLTVSMIRKLSSGLGLPAEVLLGTEEAESGEMLPGIADFFPFNEMFRRGWFNFAGGLAEAKKNADSLIHDFCCFGCDTSAIPALKRQKVRQGSEEDGYALLAWKTRVMRRAKTEKFSKPFDRKKLDRVAFKHLVSLSVQQDGPSLAFEYLKGLGVVMLVEPHLPKTHLDGAALRLPGSNRPIIALTIRFDRIDNFWFCLLHELGHVMLHILTGKAECILDELKESSGTLRERQADEFALSCTIPNEDWQRIWQSQSFEPENINREARRLMIHPGILAGRVRREKMDYSILSDLVGNGEVRILFKEFVAER